MFFYLSALKFFSYILSFGVKQKFEPRNECLLLQIYEREAYKVTSDHIRTPIITSKTITNMLIIHEI